EQTRRGSVERQFNVIYKYVGKLDGHYAVLGESGTGTSSSSVERRVMLLDVTGPPRTLLLVKTFSNGSLVPIDARIIGNKLLYTASAQPSQLAELAGLDLSAVGLSASDFIDSQMLADSDVVEFENGLLKHVWLVAHTLGRTRTEQP